jgi:hypothetical protein
MIKLKDLLNERYIASRSDTVHDVFISAVEALDDLSELFKKHAPKEKIVSTALSRTSQNIRRMVTTNKSYLKFKNEKNI